MEQRTGPKAVWFVVAGAIFVVSVVSGALVAKSGTGDKVHGLFPTQIGPAGSGHIYFEDHLEGGTHSLVYTAPALVHHGDVPKVELSVRRVGGPRVSVRANPGDAYLEPAYTSSSSTPGSTPSTPGSTLSPPSFPTTSPTGYRSRGRVEVAVFVTPTSGRYHLEGRIRAAPATYPSAPAPSLAEGELRLYPYRLRDESQKVFNGIFGVLSRVGLGILIAVVGFVVALLMVVLVAVARSRNNRPPPGPPGPYGPWTPPPGSYGPWSGGPGPPGPPGSARPTAPPPYR